MVVDVLNVYHQTFKQLQNIALRKYAKRKYRSMGGYGLTLFSSILDYIR
jgi:hypothetical protein